MSSPILLICKSCHRSSEDLPEGEKSDGTQLLEQLQATGDVQADHIQLQSVDCLWVCDHGCAAALMCADKPTYVLSDLPEGCAAALQELAHQYGASKKGHIPWEQFSPVLKSATIAKIPALSSVSTP
ncbi:MAG: DUF1636 domain-containing protein [Elainella sp. Prado103]|jgi:predicted metal-binding protein|nr:DUF1636 domain-containing protein [Elainella sp. Prado103]